MSATSYTTAVTDLLTAWLPGQRWYAGKGRAVVGVDVEHEVPLDADAGEITYLQLAVRTEDGPTDRYQLLLGVVTGDLPGRLDRGKIGEADGRVYYDAVHDAEAASTLLHRLAESSTSGTLAFRSTTKLDTRKPSRVLGAEQSNTSLVYGDEYILKLFRRVQPGTNPDLELSRALADGGSPYVAAPLGWLEGEVDGQRTTLAMLQPFLRGASDGWATATASVRDLFAEADLHADEVGGDFASESERLGTATAEVHALLARVLESRTAGPEESQATSRQLHDRLDVALRDVPELAPYADSLRAAYDAVGALTEDVPIQRVHGDYHLGQVLRTQDGWVLLDFEGEPARPLAERTALMSPLRDVAGMLRSFDYAARHLLAERAGAGAGHEPHLSYRATEWAERNRSAFCDGYDRAAGTDPRDAAVLLRAFELDKAVYEVVYEARNRPSWLSVPLGSIERLLPQAAPNAKDAQ